ncbi:hypothetical protein PANT_7c00345 [Moesziomyces antarcticus T-34]|uniref:Uncharacterized protein n=1 Tax=Pseudozyma antarctica (strain T-34) TaxID=1151754 RepID=M9MDW6_PSEA3|nr:hypothetical protein PANT_7c00345 [Moesziomyces antarcticus T-34]
MWLASVLLAAVAACLGLPASTLAFPLNYTVSQQCTPLNVTWKAVPEAFPYTVWILANHGFVQTYRINSDYQPGADHITFQYVVPPPSAGFTSYTVAVGDSRGDGNTTQTLGIATPSGSSSNCGAYTGSSAFTYAADPANGTMIQCGAVKVYNIGDRGTRPFTISFVPLGGAPVSVQVPQLYTLNISSFVYQTLVPFAQGTQFQTVVGDASGPGSGGASEIFTVGPSTFTPACLASDYRLPNQLSTPLPIASSVAMFNNLGGAIPTDAAAQKSSSGHPTGAIAGGAIGGAIALGAVIGVLVAFLLYRKRKKTKRDAARSEEVRFVDLDGDDDDDIWGTADPRRDAARPAGRSNDGGRPAGQSYTVSPFVYDPRHDGASSDGRYGQSLEMTSPSSANPSYGELLSAAGLSSAAVSPMDDYPSRAGNASIHSHSSQNPFSSRAAGIERSGTSGSGGDGSHPYATGAGMGIHSASSLPSKAQMSAQQERRDNRAQRRVVQHSDGGPLPQPSSDTEDEEVVDELPPEYGGWLQNNANASGSGGAPPPTSAGSARVAGDYAYAPR